jgi:uncharacterized protein
MSNSTLHRTTNRRLVPRTAADHRPYPPPDSPWIMRQVWNDLLFAHWPIPPDEMRAVLPPVLRPHLDLYEGQAWLAVTPFWMSGVRLRLLPPLPWLSTFPELNVRTYVTLGGRPGVYFFSLDAGNPIAVLAARLFYHLPYFNASMRVRTREATLHYESRRTHRRARLAELRLRYRPTGSVGEAVPGSLADWLTARYCLYAVSRRGRVYRAEIDHAPWPLQPAEAEFELNTMATAARLNLPDTSPLLHFVDRLEMVGWWPHVAKATC